MRYPAPSKKSIMKPARASVKKFTTNCTRATMKSIEFSPMVLGLSVYLPASVVSVGTERLFWDRYSIRRAFDAIAVVAASTGPGIRFVRSGYPPSSPLNCVRRAEVCVQICINMHMPEVLRRHGLLGQKEANFTNSPSVKNFLPFLVRWRTFMIASAPVARARFVSPSIASPNSQPGGGFDVCGGASVIISTVPKEV